MQGRYAGSSADRAVTAALCRARCVKQFSLTGPWPYRGVMSQVREMNEADVEAVSAIRVRGWQAAYAGIVPQAYLDAMTIGGDAEQRRDWFSRPLRQSTDLVALDSGDLVGWISFGPYRGQAAGAGRTGRSTPSTSVPTSSAGESAVRSSARSTRAWRSSGSRPRRCGCSTTTSGPVASTSELGLPARRRNSGGRLRRRHAHRAPLPPRARAPWKDGAMERVPGIGGYFLRAADPAALSAWYRDCGGRRPIRLGHRSRRQPHRAVAARLTRQRGLRTPARSRPAATGRMPARRPGPGCPAAAC